ncbi:hypothetical protein [uncultured Roseobacter sp.]|uniref:hypothetical protein n=1 Tax=uncultured Roseobacter sp. TaxID=114847 RepID=UPI00260FD4C1|nr:hypothetical protein [uncultured Roseobacter sp.]
MGEDQHRKPQGFFFYFYLFSGRRTTASKPPQYTNAAGVPEIGFFALASLNEKRMRIVVCMLCAFVVGAVYFLAYNYKVTTRETSQRQQLIDMTNAFTSAFAVHRDEDNLVPATFRRIGIQEFTDSVKKSVDVRATASTMRMPGTPGLELNTIEEDTRIRSIIAGMAQARTATRHNEHFWSEGRFVGRTIVPSVASADSCVGCHNAALGEEIYEVGDVMGAFVVETDLTRTVMQGAVYAIATAPLVGFLVFILITAQAKRSAKTVTALKRQVTAEQKAANGGGTSKVPGIP